MHQYDRLHQQCDTNKALEQFSQITKTYIRTDKAMSVVLMNAVTLRLKNSLGLE